MTVGPKLCAPIAAALAAMAWPAHAEGRAELVACQAMVDRAAPPLQAGSATAVVQPDEAALARCRQIIKDWTLRESRMSVDEQGRPLR